MPSSGTSSHRATRCSVLGARLDAPPRSARRQGAPAPPKSRSRRRTSSPAASTGKSWTCVIDETASADRRPRAATPTRGASPQASRGAAHSDDGRLSDSGTSMGRLQSGSDRRGPVLRYPDASTLASAGDHMRSRRADRRRRAAATAHRARRPHTALRNPSRSRPRGAALPANGGPRTRGMGAARLRSRGRSHLRLRGHRRQPQSPGVRSPLAARPPSVAAKCDLCGHISRRSGHTSGSLLRTIGSQTAEPADEGVDDGVGFGAGGVRVG